MPLTEHHHPSRRRTREPSSPGRSADCQVPRRQGWAGKTPSEILATYAPGKASPQRVLDVLIELFNTRHTSIEKTVSHKTRHERAQFLRRFFRDLKRKAGFKTLPDPRNLGQKHIRAMVQVWQRERLAPATVQTYLSFLRGLATWTGKHGFVRGPGHYGLHLDEYQRHESAQRDKSWSAQGIDIDELVGKVCTFDRYVGASLRLVRALGLRRKEAVQFRPFEHVMTFGQTGLASHEKAADRYVKTKGKGGRVRMIALDEPGRLAAVAFAQAQVSAQDAHIGDPARDLEANLRRFDYVLAKFGLTLRQLGATAHGLRHEVLITAYTASTGEPPPVRGGMPLPAELDRAARRHVAELAGHARTRASCAYLGGVVRQKAPVGGSAPRPKPPGAEAPGPRPSERADE